jgi:hypothetical protein
MLALKTLIIVLVSLVGLAGSALAQNKSVALVKCELDALRTVLQVDPRNSGLINASSSAKK